MKILGAFASAALLACALGACGGDAGGSDGGAGYCDKVEQAADAFGGLSSDAGDLESAFTSFHTLADAAPQDLADEWAELDDAISAVEKAFEDAGVDISDLEKIETGEIPPDLDLSKLEALATAMEGLDGPEVADALSAIEKHAKEDCDVDLNASSKS